MHNDDERDHLEELASAALLQDEALRSCYRCGCTDDRACVDDDGRPCSWVTGDLCSACLDRDLERLRRGVDAFADEMRELEIHVGLGNPGRCVTCGEAWPCAGSRTDG